MTEREMLHEKLRTGTIKEIKEIYFLHFHSIKHAESFGILIERLEQKDKEICKNCKWWNPEFITIDALKSETDNWCYGCMAPKINYSYRERTEFPDGLDVEFDEGWGMSPRAEYGCVHFICKSSKPWRITQRIPKTG